MTEMDLFRFTQEYQQVVTSSAPLAVAAVITENIESYILNLSQTMLVWVNRRYVCGASMSDTGRVTAWFNNQPYHSVSVSVGLVHNALVRAQLGPDYQIDVSNAPLPYTTNTRMELVQLAGNMGFQLAINLGFAMAFVAAFYVLTYILVSFPDVFIAQCLSKCHCRNAKPEPSCCSLSAVLRC